MAEGRYQCLPVEDLYARAFETAKTVSLVATGITDRTLNLLGQGG